VNGFTEDELDAYRALYKELLGLNKGDKAREVEILNLLTAARTLAYSHGSVRLEQLSFVERTETEVFNQL
jgi:hypothetical protein